MQAFVRWVFVVGATFLAACGVDEVEPEAPVSAEAQPLQTCTPMNFYNFSPSCQSLTLLLESAKADCGAQGLYLGSYSSRRWCETSYDTCRDYPFGHVCSFEYRCCS